MPMNPRLLVPRATFDPDAAAYLRAVEAADGQALETPVKRAVDDFIKGCKADGTLGCDQGFLHPLRGSDAARGIGAACGYGTVEPQLFAGRLQPGDGAER
jgi:hypothetical protein